MAAYGEHRRALGGAGRLADLRLAIVAHGLAAAACGGSGRALGCLRGAVVMMVVVRRGASRLHAWVIHQTVSTNDRRL